MDSKQVQIQLPQQIGVEKRKPMVIGNFERFTTKKLVDFVVDKDKDFWIFFSGKEGVGKSNNCLVTAKLIAKSGKFKFNMDNVVWDQNHFIGKLQSEQNTIIVSDEGGESLFNRDYMNPDQKELIKTIIRNRFLNNIVIVNYPRIKFIDSDVRDHRINLLGICFARNGEKGHCLFFKGSSISLVQEFFTNLEKNKIRLTGEKKILALVKFVRPDFYVKFPDLNNTSPKFWGDYVFKKNEAHREKVKKFQAMKKLQRQMFAINRQKADAKLKELGKKYNVEIFDE